MQAMNEQYLSVLQALQLVGLFPCLFVVFFLLAIVRDYQRTFLPALYFLALGAGFYLPLANLFPLGNQVELVRAIDLFHGLLPALGFLLILQLIRGRIPLLSYWSVLPILLLINGALLFFAGDGGRYCAGAQQCIESEALKSVVHVLTTALIFLVLMPIVMRNHATIDPKDLNRSQKYWLVLALILLHISIPAIELFVLVGSIDEAQHLAIHTVIVFSFIYLVLTSLFRVFDDAMLQRQQKQRMEARQKLSEDDRVVAERIERVIREKQYYQKMGYTREECAEAFGIAEHKLSRLLNVFFKKNFNEFINGFRIEEAKERLRDEPKTSVTVIAFEVGFNSIASFNRVFKEIVGTSPTAYRTEK